MHALPRSLRAFNACPPSTPTRPPQSHVNHWGCTTYYLGAMNRCGSALGLYRGTSQQGRATTKHGWSKPQPLLTWQLLT